MKLKPITAHTRLHLGDGGAKPPHDLPRGARLERAIAVQTDRISRLQRVFYADRRYALLIVLQGRDASGKDGTIRQVFSAVNPQGCQVTSFGVPTDVEASHDFLWRVHQRVPARGMIGIFNRSHYEDILVPRVHRTVPRRVWSSRFGQINDFEHMLVASGVVILKFFLHVSRDEQKRRLTERLTDETKNWKFRQGDLDDRARWTDYTRGYRDVLRECSPKWAPWFVVPADDKPARNLLVARTIADALDDLDLRYPPGDPAVLGIKVE